MEEDPTPDPYFGKLSYMETRLQQTTFLGNLKTSVEQSSLVIQTDYTRYDVRAFERKESHHSIPILLDGDVDLLCADHR